MLGERDNRLHYGNLSSGSKPKSLGARSGEKRIKGKAFLRQLTAQRVHTFLQKETAVSTRF